MSTVPSNVSQLDPILQQLINNNITLREDEMRVANLSLKSVLLDTMQSKMKIVDDTFQALYKQPHYVGSYYENLRVGHPTEFDINLELQLPIRESDIEIETEGTVPGFTKIRVEKNFHTHISANVIRRIESWLKDRYLCRDSVIQWLQGVVDKVLINVEWPQNMTVNRNMSGPAVTLNVRKNAVEFSVDLVPVFSFGTSRLPPEPLNQFNNSRQPISAHLKWCVVPKSPRQASASRHQWRMSYYMYEKELINNQNNMKPVIKLIKLLRDRQKWDGLASYYIKTIFLWEQKQQAPHFWRNGLGYVFMHMLGKLEYYLQQGRIPFFWDKRSNLIGHLSESQIQNMSGRVTRLKGRLEQAISSHDKNNIASVMDLFYPVSQSLIRKPSPEAGGLQQAESSNWTTPVAGIVMGVGAAMVVGSIMAMFRNRNNN